MESFRRIVSLGYPAGMAAAWPEQSAAGRAPS